MRVTLFLINILLALAWIALTGHFTATNLFIGLALGYLTLWITQRYHSSAVYFVKLRQLGGFIVYFAWELLKANLRVAYEVITPRYQMKPAILAIPLEAKTDLEITAFANLITLTPGTLSLEVSEDRKALYIHAMYVDDAALFKERLKQGLERRLLEVLR